MTIPPGPPPTPGPPPIAENMAAEAARLRAAGVNIGDPVDEDLDATLLRIQMTTTGMLLVSRRTGATLFFRADTGGPGPP